MRALLVAFVVVFAGCLAGTDPAPDAGADAPPPGAQPTGTRLLVLGDTGTGKEGQLKVADAAFAVCAARGCDAAVLLGDNIYETGVSSVTDPQFDEKFEVPYAKFSIPFYAVLGNHDNGGGGIGNEPERGDFQVQYTERADRASDKWQMPGRYYDVRLGDVHLFGLDTTSLFFNGYPSMDALAARQRAWIETELPASNATWRIVMGHHPYISNGVHHDSGTFEGVPGGGLLLKDTYEQYVCGHADFVLGGHDHDLQWLKAVPACPKTEHIVSGAGAKMRPLGDENRHEARYQKGDTLGFAWIHFDGASATVAFYDGDGAKLYERVATK